MKQQITGKRGMKMYHVICMPEISLMTIMMSVQPVDNHIPIDGRGVTEAFLMDNTPMKLFFDSGAARSYLSKKYYDANKSLHRLPKFSTTCTGIKIGNGSIIPTLFVIPIQFMAHGHIFEIYTIVAAIDDGMVLVFGFKNMAETEGRLNTRTGEYDFIGRSIPVYPQNDLDVPGGKQVLIKRKVVWQNHNKNVWK